jgi:hypothetical protein
VPRRLDVRLVFPGVRGGVLDLKHVRRAQTTVDVREEN